MTNQMILFPGYMKQFSCIGPACEDSCCKGWNVTIDKETYKKYRKINDNKWQQQFENSIKRNKDSSGGNDFGYIQLKEDASCPMLDQEGLCSIHKDFGHELLSYTCQVYPRNYNQYNDIIEESLTLSCPEAARLALLNQEKVEFDLDERVLPYRANIGKQVLTSTMGRKDHRKYFFDIRSLVIDLLQERSFSISERLIIIGLYVKRLTEGLATASFEQITESFVSSIQNIGDEKQSFSNFAKRTDVKLQMLISIIEMRVSGGLNSSRYIECLEKVQKGLMLNDSSVRKEDQIKKYEETFENIVASFLADHEYIFENYLVQHAFASGFGMSKNLFNDYSQLVLHYALVKLHIVGLAAYHGELTVELVLKLIQSFTKTVNHNQEFLRAMTDVVNKNNANTYAHMAVLVHG